MSKQIYIDSNGNEIQVSGTVNSADMLPLEAGSSKMTSEAIGSLSSLTTTNKDSLVDAVNEVNGGLLKVKTQQMTVSFDSTGEGILFNSNVNVLAVNDVLGGSPYVAYIAYFSGTSTRVKNFGRSLVEVKSIITSASRDVIVTYLE